ncbi:MAG: ABC transporter permease, partial [Cryomorphaceae bacterium]
RKQVTEIIREALPGTVVLALCAISFALVFGIAGGVVAAVYKGRFIDGFSLFAAVLGMSAPSFFAAIIISWLGGYVWAAQTSLPVLPIVFGVAALIISLAVKKGRSGVKSVTFFIKGVLVGFGLQLLNAGIQSFWGISLVPGAGAALHLPGTGLNMTGSLYDVDIIEGEYLALHNLILPVITLGIRPLAVVVQLTRNALLDVLSQDYIRTARAKGLSEWKILIGHALRNAMNPVITAISGWFASMLAGAVFIEFIFNWKGLGLQVFTSLQNDDYPVVMGAVLVIAVTFVFINILVDIIYGWLDPRIRLA